MKTVPDTKGRLQLGQEHLVRMFQGWSCCSCGGAAEERWVSQQDLELGLLGGTENGALLREVGLLLPRDRNSAAVHSFLPLWFPKADTKLPQGVVNEYNLTQGPK